MAQAVKLRITILHTASDLKSPLPFRILDTKPLRTTRPIQQTAVNIANQRCGCNNKTARAPKTVIETTCVTPEDNNDWAESSTLSRKMSVL